MMKRGKNITNLNEHYEAEIVFPATGTNEEKLKGARAQHFDICEQIDAENRHWKSEEFLKKAPEKIYDILYAEHCLPYWKMRLILSILNSVAKLEPGKDTAITKLKENLEEYKAELDKDPNYPDIYDNVIQNRMLNEKLNNIDFSTIVEANIKQWDFDKKILSRFRINSFWIA